MSIEDKILAAVDALPARRKARLMPKLRRRLKDYYDQRAAKRARKKDVYYAYADLRRELRIRRAAK